jgi:prophage tail gpP-like protein/phage tail protein X
VESKLGIMSKFYQVKSGDTLSSIALRFYGNNTEFPRIQQANPVVQDPNVLNTIWVLTIPDIPGSSEKIEPSTPLIGGDKDEVSITIDNQQFYLWEDTSITLGIDTIDSFQFSIPWDPFNDELKKIFKPYQYKQIGITIGGEKVITGTIVKHDPRKLANSSRLTLSGYALPGILQDVNVPTNLYPIELFDNDLEQIAKKLCDPFSITPVFEADKGSTFKSVTISPTDKILDFLIKLAKQRGLIVTSNEVGELVFQTVATGKAKTTIKEGLFPFISGSGTLDGQQRFSTITALSDNWNGKSSGSYVANDNTITVNRPHVFTTNHITKGELQKAANAKMGRSFATSIQLPLNVTGWRDSDGDRWEKNSRIIYQSPTNFIYKETEFIIRLVTFTRRPDGLVSNFQLVFPEAFTGEIRTSYPWD